MENIKLEIIDLDDNGRGIARKDNIIYFVNNAKLGETVEARTVQKKKSFIIAEKIKTITPSPYLNENSVEENKLCGVFDLYDISYKHQISFKRNNILNTINRIAGENLNDINFISAENQYHYRNKLELKLTPTGKLAHFSRKSNSFVEVDECVMVTNEINTIVQKLQNLILDYGIQGYDPKTNKGLVKNIIIRSTSLGDTMCIFVLNKERNMNDFYKAIQNEKIISSFYISINSKKNDYKIQKLQHIFGKKKIQEKLGEYNFNISPKAFFQVNKDIAFQIYQKAREYVKKIHPSILVDLYSGVSTTSIILSDICKKIISVEINKDAVLDAKENALLNGVDNIEWMSKPAEKAIEEINLEFDNGMALFDPPRAGLDNLIIEKIGKSKIDSIVYISCNPSTLARDIKRFKQYGYSLEEVTGYDQFVNTVEAEVIVLLSR
ncbi:23S rRNA (uracil(1939)-C(5))-methyltransferase RlmD [Helcococcus kunzii]